MAIDTRNKRASATNCGMPFLRNMPAPDGTVSTADRRHALGYYRMEAAAATTVAYFTIPNRLLHPSIYH